jgi:hypothetical protein
LQERALDAVKKAAEAGSEFVDLGFLVGKEGSLGTERLVDFMGVMTRRQDILTIVRGAKPNENQLTVLQHGRAYRVSIDKSKALPSYDAFHGKWWREQEIHVLDTIEANKIAGSWNQGELVEKLAS